MPRPLECARHAAVVVSEAESAARPLERRWADAYLCPVCALRADGAGDQGARRPCASTMSGRLARSVSNWLFAHISI